MDISHVLFEPDMNNEDLCLADNVTTHTILKSKRYFSTLTMLEVNVNTISGSTKLIKGFGKANIIPVANAPSKIETQFIKLL